LKGGGFQTRFSVTLLAHQTVTFARDQLGEEVQDEIRRLIVELRKRFEKG
jgi:hypothetical protein